MATVTVVSRVATADGRETDETSLILSTRVHFIPPGPPHAGGGGGGGGQEPERGAEGQNQGGEVLSGVPGEESEDQITASSERESSTEVVSVGRGCQKAPLCALS